MTMTAPLQLDRSASNAAPGVPAAPIPPPVPAGARTAQPLSDDWKPRLKNDTLYIPAAEGVHIVSNAGMLTLKGKHVYQWLDSVAPYLDGTRLLSEITGKLSADRRSLVVNLVRALLDKGFVKDVTSDRPSGLSAEEREGYASAIAFVDYYVDSAAHRFERYRNSRVLALGSGVTLTALVHANLHAGLRSVDVAVTSESETDRSRHAEYLELARQRDPSQRLVEHSMTGLVGEGLGEGEAVTRALGSCDAILHVCDRPMLARARRLNRIALEHGVPLIQAVVEGDTAWIGPLVDGGDGPCWECAWLRLLGQRERPPLQPFEDAPRAGVTPFLAGPTASIVSSLLSFELFKHTTGVPSLETAGALVELDLETLQSRAHPVQRHPACSAHGVAVPMDSASFIARLERRRAEADSTASAEAFSKSAAQLFDARTGVLGVLDEGDLGQLPLKVCRATVSNPQAGFGHGSPATVYAAATEFSLARERAARRACEVYAARAAASSFVHGYDLSSGSACTIPHANAGAFLDGAPSSESERPGLASGFSWSEAIVRGLLACCEQLTVEELTRRATPCARLAIERLPRTEVSDRHLRTLELLEAPVCLYEVTGSLGVPTIGACLGDHTVCYASHLDPAQAIESALEAVVLHHQAHESDRAELGPPPPAPLRPELRGAEPGGLPAASSTPPRRAWQEWQQQLVARLQHAGWQLVAVPLDHDPVLQPVLPYIVQIVLRPAGGASLA
jgi:putative thiazole-containing bacteriocin maturation protein